MKASLAPHLMFWRLPQSLPFQKEKLQINGRNAAISPDEKGFDSIVVFQRLAAGGNIGIGFKQAKDFKKFGEGQGVIVIENASVVPSVDLAGAGILYVEDPALKYHGDRNAPFQSVLAVYTCVAWPTRGGYADPSSGPTLAIITARDMKARSVTQS